MPATTSLAGAATWAPRKSGGRGWKAGLLAMCGGALVAAGALLPWFPLFAGLQPYAGTTGLYGRILLGGGVLAFAVGAVVVMRGGAGLRRAPGALGVLLLGFAAWLGIGLYQVFHGLTAQPMLVAQLGPGFFVSAAGALIVVPAMLVPRN